MDTKITCQYAPVKSCIIHHASVSGNDKLVSPTSIESLNTLCKAAAAREYSPLLNICKEGCNEIPFSILYHAACRSRFTMKRDLQHIKRMDEETNEEPIAKRKSLRSEIQISESESRVYDMKCIFKGIICKSQSKYIKGTNTREKLRQCVELRTDERLRQLAQERGDEHIMAITSRELVAAEAMYHPSCYKVYTKATYIPVSHSEDYAYTTAENAAYSELFLHIRNTLFQHSTGVVTLSEIALKLVSYMQDKGIECVKQSTKKHIRRRLELEFGESLQFISLNNNKVCVYPSNISVKNLVIENYKLKNELETMRSKSDDNISVVKKAALYLNEAVKHMSRS